MLQYPGLTNQISGNTAGATAYLSTGTVVIAGGNNVTLSQNGNSVTISGPNVSQYLTTAALSNQVVNSLNGSVGQISLNVGSSLSASTNGSSITFGLASNITTALQSAGAYLTTAALSNHSHNFATTTTNGSLIVVGTTNSAGATIAVPPYLTTAQAPGAYLTTARASNDAIGLNTALTANGVSVTANSSGLSLNFPAFLTTAALSNHSHNFATTTTNGAVIVVGTTNSAGATIGVPAFLTTAQAPGAYLTTAALSNHSHNFATTTTNGASIIVATTNSNGATIAVPAYLTTAQSPGAYLTTARASNDAIGLNTALTANGVSVTANSSGLSLNFPAFLTTAALSNHSHGNPQLNLTNLSGTTASNSAGFTLSLSAAAPGGGGAINVSAGTTNGNLQTIQFNDSYGISFGLSGSTITASVSSPPPPDPAFINFSAGTTSNDLDNVVFDNANGVSFGMNGATITASVNAGGGGFDQRWEQIPMLRFSLSNLTNITAISNVPFFQPVKFYGNFTLSRVNFEMSRSTSGSNAFTVSAGIYSYSNETALSLIASATAVYSNTATASVSGIRRFGLGGFDVSTFTAGGYVIGMQFNAGTNTASMNYSIRGHSGAIQAGAILAGSDSYNTATNYNIFPFFGRYSATVAFPTSVADSAIRGQFGGASAPINAWIGFNND